MSNSDDENQAQEEVRGTPKPEKGMDEEIAAQTGTAIQNNGKGKSIIEQSDMDFLNEVMITISIEVGRAQVKIKDLLNLSKDSIIDLDKNSNEPVDIYANGKLISRGNIITSNGKYSVRLISVTEPVGSA